MNANKHLTPADTVLQLVADRRRRTVLQHMIENGDESVPIEELVTTITSEESADGEQRTETAERVAIELHHVHLPKMTQGGIIDCDARSGSVRYHSQDDVEELIQFISERLE